jgi:hypothetical protein
MKINTTLVSLADAQRLLDAIQKLGYTPPKTLSDVLTAREKLAEAPAPIPNPTKTLVAAALHGRDVDEILQATAIARLVNEERKSLPGVEGELLSEFGKRLDGGGADAALDLMRPRFDKAAGTLRTAQAAIDVPADPAAFLNTAIRRGATRSNVRRRRYEFHPAGTDPTDQPAARPTIGPSAAAVVIMVDPDLAGLAGHICVRWVRMQSQCCVPTRQVPPRSS